MNVENLSLVKKQDRFETSVKDCTMWFGIGRCTEIHFKGLLCAVKNKTGLIPVSRTANGDLVLVGVGKWA